MTVLIISILRMPFLVPTLDNAVSFFAMMITPAFYLHHVEMTDQDPARGWVYMQIQMYKSNASKISLLDTFVGIWVNTKTHPDSYKSVWSQILQHTYLPYATRVGWCVSVVREETTVWFLLYYRI